MLAAAAVAKGMETNTDVIKWDEIQQEYIIRGNIP